MLSKILTQEKNMRTSGDSSEHKHSEIERFSTLNEQIICSSIIQSSKLRSRCQLSI